MIIESLKLNETYQYQIIFILSMCLYHSTQFFGMNIKQNRFLLGLFDSLNNFQLQILFILLVFIMIVLIIWKTFMSSVQNYFVEIMDKVFYPVQLYVFLKVIKQNWTDQQTFSFVTKIFFLVSTMQLFNNFSLNTVILITKNLKFSFRYRVNREKGFNRLSNIEYLLTITKIIISIILDISLPENFLVYIILTGIINIFINLSFSLNVIYQHPNIEYISLLTQFYLWAPFFTQILTYTNLNNHSIFIFNIVQNLLYLSLSLIKPKLFMSLLQKKYNHLIKSTNEQILISNQLKNPKLSENLIVIASITVSLVFQTQKYQKKLQWSNSFKSNLLLFIQSKTQNEVSTNQEYHFQNHNQNKFSEVLSQSKQHIKKQKRVSNIFKNSEKFSYIPGLKQKQIDLLQEVRLRLKNTKSHNTQSNQNYGNVYEILWSFFYPYVSSHDKAFANLRFFICYVFPDIRQNMKFRLFHSYYLNQFEKMDFFHIIQARLCQKNLIKLVGNRFNQQKYIQKVDSQQNERQMDCFFKERTFYHQKFNDLVKENQLRLKIIIGFGSFLQNEQLYLRIFQNIKENREDIRKYYKNRRDQRLQIQENLVEYEKLHNKKSHFLMVANYMKQYFINKNEHFAQDKFEKQVSKIMVSKKHYLRESVSNTKSSDCFGKRIIQSMKYNQLANGQSENIICVVSGLKKLGLIKIVSPRFKELMEVDQNQFLTESQSSKMNYLSHYQLPFWTQSHNQKMKQIQFYQKPVHHNKNKCFLISHKGNNLIQMNFKMYFFVLFQTDLLLVLDIKYQKCKYLEIKDCFQNTIYSYDQNKNKIIPNSRVTQKKQDQVLNQQEFFNFLTKQQRYKCQKVQLYNNTYTIKTLNKLKVSTFLGWQCISQKRMMNRSIFDKKISQQNFIRQGKKMLEQKFISYKKDFHIYEKLWNFIRTMVIGSIVFFVMTFFIFLFQETLHQQSSLRLIKDKLLIQNKIICMDAYSTIQIGMLYGISTGLVWFDSTEKKQQFMNYQLTSLAVLKNQLRGKKQLEQLEKSNSKQLIRYLYQSDWIPGNDASFMTHTLRKQSLFFQSLSIFVDPLLLTTAQNSTNPDRFSTVVLPSNISLKQQSIIMKNLYSTIGAKSYFFNPNGVLDHIFYLEKQLSTFNSNIRTFLFVIIEFGFTIFSIFIIFSIINLKKNILNHYNQAILVSESFRRNFLSETKKLQNYISQLKRCSQNDLSQKIRPQQINYRQESRKFTYIRKYTGQGFKKSIWNKKGRYQQQDAKLNLLKYLFQSVLFPFLRYFVILGSVYCIYQSRTNNMEILSKYSNSLKVLSRLNTDFIESYGISLYIQKLHSDPNIVEILKEQFIKCTQQIRSVDKVQIIYDIFPFNQQLAHSVLYQSTIISLKKLNVESYDISSLSQKSFLEKANRLLIIQKALFNRFNKSKPHLDDVRIHLIECYQQVRNLFWFLDVITERSYQLVQQQIAFDYKGWIIVLVAFLVIEFMMGSLHFNRAFTEFNEQFLNLASYEQLGKQEGFEKFVNLSKKEYFIIINQDGSYMNHA